MSNDEYLKKEKPDRHRTQRAAFWGIVGGAIFGMIGFAIFDSEYFILSPFILGLLGFVVGFVVDKKVEFDKNRKIFKNKI